MRRLLHLARRFFEVLRAEPLSPSDQTEVASLLRPEEASYFWGQAVPDQRHALAAARRVAAVTPERRELLRAALLHDVGKRHVPLGIAGRTVASALDLLHLPAPGRMGNYLAHCETGAADLTGAGSESIVVAFARSHHGPRPAEINEADWRLLLTSDGERKPR
jgi:hypothetical protein